MGRICQGAPGGHQTALESCCHSPDKYLETLLLLGERLAGIRGHTVKRKEGVARLQGGSAPFCSPTCSSVVHRGEQCPPAGWTRG